MGTPFRLEAENFDLLNFGIEANTTASGNSLIELFADNITARGKAQTQLNLSGNYDVFLGYYDDSSGQSQLGVRLGGKTLKYWTLNKDLSNNADSDSFIRRQLGSSIAILPGQSLEIIGSRQDSENVRVDYIEFISLDEEPPEPSGTLQRLEVETFDLSDGSYSIGSSKHASGGKLVSTKREGAASQTLDFAGTYDIYVGYFDESDGVSQMQFSLGGKRLDSWSLDSTSGTPWVSDRAIARRQVAQGQTITPGMLLQLSGQSDNAEYARFDYVEFVPTTGTPTSAPPLSPAPAPMLTPVPVPVPVPTPTASASAGPTATPIRFEAEALALSNYRVQAIPNTSGNQIIDLGGGNEKERGTASKTLDLDGVYDVFIGYFDQNDGRGAMSVSLDSDKLKYWQLNKSSGSATADSASFIRRRLADSQVITPGTKLEVFGSEDGGDGAAVDYVEFIPVDLSTRPGRLEFGQTDYIFNESGLLGAEVTINRIAGYSGTVETSLSLVGDTATADRDFVGSPITVSFAPGEVTKTVSIPIINDSEAEFTERMTLQLGQPSNGATLGDAKTAQLVIVDDEETLEPRLFLEEGKVEELKAAIQVPGSHHALAFNAMKARVDQNDWRVYDENLNDSNHNYARSWLAREAAMMYQLTDDPNYGQISYNSLLEVYENPGFSNANLTSPSGLARAMMGLGFAISYDWAAKAWTPEQRAWVKGKLIEGLDSWESFNHPNVREPFASNWTAVTRGAEVVTMLALEEEVARSDRYRQIKSDLERHIINGYGEYGYNQEGNGYLSYGGSVLATAVNALRSTGDRDLDAAFESKEFWKLPLYGSVFNADQDSVQYGVGNVRFNAEGWTSFMFADVPDDQQGYYKYAYDLARGVNNPAEDSNKFEAKRSATTWSLIYYPTEVTAIDPDSNPGEFSPLLASEDKGGYFFRNRWQDADDTIVSLIGDFKSLPNAWNQPETLNLGLYAYGDRFIAGPKNRTDADAFSSLLIDGKIPKQDATGQREFSEANATGGYVIVDGGQAYEKLGITSTKRHLDVEFNPDGSTLLSTLDQVRDESQHNYTWQINVGESLDNGGISVTTGNEGGLQTFLLSSADGDYVKGWVLEPSNVVLDAGDPLKITATGVNTDLWVAMLTGQGQAPTATVTGYGLDAVLTVANNQLYYDAERDRIISESLNSNIVNLGSPVATPTSESDSFGFISSDSLLNITPPPVDL